MFIQYLGYQPRLNSRTYSFRVIVPPTQEREFTMSIEKQSLMAGGFKCQDMPDLCYSKLKEDLAMELPENPLPLEMTITDTDLRMYREKHYPAKRKFS
jgi:hypothetical protein